MHLQSASGEMLLLPSVLVLLYVEISLSTSADCGFAAIILARAKCNDFVLLSPIMAFSKSLGSELLSSVICPASRHDCTKSAKLWSGTIAAWSFLKSSSFADGRFLIAARSAKSLSSNLCLRNVLMLRSTSFRMAS